MGEKRFHTRRQWHNTMVVLITLPFSLVLGLLVGMVSGAFWPLFLFMSLTALGLAIALYRDRSNSSTYSIFGDQLVLVNGVNKLMIQAGDVIDASLIERSGARDYIIQKLISAGVQNKAERLERMAEFTRFCTVDIGLRSYTLGIGRSMIDRMPKAKHDLVLLRTRNGIDHLLSPAYNQDLVDSIGRMLRKPVQA